MNEKSTDSTAKVMARRRLVRGVFAAPAALTLYSGGAMAATSVSCVAQQQDPSNIVGDPGTAWVRIPLWTITAQGNRGSTWVKGADMAALMPSASYLSSTQWQLIARQNNSAFSPVGLIVNSTPSQPVPSSPNVTPVVTNTYVAVRIDATGKIVGVEPLETTLGSAISGSCWTSFGGNLI